MTARPAPLFDVEPLRTLDRSTLGVLGRDGPVVVLGARQPIHDLDVTALERDGIAICRRHGVHGVDATAHRGAVLGADQGSVACFAGLGPGELTLGDQKILGISQWRVREGALVSSVLAVEPPGDLGRYLSSASSVPRLSGAASVLSRAPGLSVDAVVATFAEIASSSEASVEVDRTPFS